MKPPAYLHHVLRSKFGYWRKKTGEKLFVFAAASINLRWASSRKIFGVRFSRPSRLSDRSKQTRAAAIFPLDVVQSDLVKGIVAVRVKLPRPG